MTKSMTGYGRSDFSIGERAFTVEAKSLNHRYLDIKLRMPERFFALEENIRTTIKKLFSRGHFSILIKPSDTGSEAAGINSPLVDLCIEAAETLKARGIKGDLTIDAVMGQRDIFSAGGTTDDTSGDLAALSSALNEALSSLSEWRRVEGEELSEDISSRLSYMEAAANGFEEAAPEIERAYRERLTEKITALIGDAVDETRILTEAAFVAEKSAFDEEITRLKSHLQRFRQYLLADGPVGRKMDFLCQELLREVNTTGSKVTDVNITQKIVDVKAELEKIREQVQNIE